MVQNLHVNYTCSGTDKNTRNKVFHTSEFSLFISSPLYLSHLSRCLRGHGSLGTTVRQSVTWSGLFVAISLISQPDGAKFDQLQLLRVRVARLGSFIISQWDLQTESQLCDPLLTYYLS